MIVSKEIVSRPLKDLIAQGYFSQFGTSLDDDDFSATRPYDTSGPPLAAFYGGFMGDTSGHSGIAVRILDPFFDDVDIQVLSPWKDWAYHIKFWPPKSELDDTRKLVENYYERVCNVLAICWKCSQYLNGQKSIQEFRQQFKKFNKDFHRTWKTKTFASLDESVRTMFEKEFLRPLPYETDEETKITVLMFLHELEEMVRAPTENPIEKFMNDSIPECQAGEELKTLGNRAYKDHKYSQALKCYSDGLKKSPHHYRLYSNRAVTNLKLHNPRAALWDSIRAIILCKTHAKAHMYHIRALVDLGRKGEALLASDLAFSCCKDEQDYSKELKRLVDNMKEEAGNVFGKIPARVYTKPTKPLKTPAALSAPTATQGKKKDKSKEESKSKAKPKQQKVELPTPITPELSKEESKSKAKPKQQKVELATPITPELPPEVRLHRERYRQSLAAGSQRLQEQQYRPAITQYQTCRSMLLKEDHRDILEVTVTDKALLQYAHGFALVGLFTEQDILQAIELFQDIIENYSEAIIVRPLVHCSVGSAFCKLHRFDDAVPSLRKCLQIEENTPFGGSLTWPGTSAAIPLTREHKLKEEAERLLELCRWPPAPVAVCRYQDCSSCGFARTEIYTSGPDFKGYIQISCSRLCVVAYHNNCWRKWKQEFRENLSDRDVLGGGACPTPDCAGFIHTITVYDMDQQIKSQQTQDSQQEQIALPKKVTKQAAVSEQSIQKKKARKERRRKWKEQDRLKREKGEESDREEEDSEEILSALEKKAAATGDSANAADAADRDHLHLEAQHELKKERLEDSQETVGKKKKRKKPQKTAGLTLDELHRTSKDPDSVEAPSMYAAPSRAEIERFEMEYKAEQEAMAAVLNTPEMNNVKEDVISIFGGILQQNGPLHITDPLLTGYLADMPLAVKSAVNSIGNIGKFLSALTSMFVFLNDFVSRTEDVQLMRERVSTHRWKEQQRLQSVGSSMLVTQEIKDLMSKGGGSAINEHGQRSFDERLLEAQKFKMKASMMENATNGSGKQQPGSHFFHFPLSSTSSATGSPSPATGSPSPPVSVGAPNVAVPVPGPVGMVFPQGPVMGMYPPPVMAPLGVVPPMNTTVVPAPSPPRRERKPLSIIDPETKEPVSLKETGGTESNQVDETLAGDHILTPVEATDEAELLSESLMSSVSASQAPQSTVSFDTRQQEIGASSGNGHLSASAPVFTPGETRDSAHAHSAGDVTPGVASGKSTSTFGVQCDLDTVDRDLLGAGDSVNVGSIEDILGMTTLKDLIQMVAEEAGEDLGIAGESPLGGSTTAEQVEWLNENLLPALAEKRQNSQKLSEELSLVTQELQTQRDRQTQEKNRHQVEMQEKVSYIDDLKSRFMAKSAELNHSNQKITNMEKRQKSELKAAQDQVDAIRVELRNQTAAKELKAELEQVQRELEATKRAKETLLVEFQTTQALVSTANQETQRQETRAKQAEIASEKSKCDPTIKQLTKEMEDVGNFIENVKRLISNVSAGAVPQQAMVLHTLESQRTEWTNHQALLQALLDDVRRKLGERVAQLEGGRELASLPQLNPLKRFPARPLAPLNDIAILLRHDPFAAPDTVVGPAAPTVGLGRPAVPSGPVGAPPAGGVAMAPPAGGVAMAPPSGGGAMAPAAGGVAMAPPAGGVAMANPPPSAGPQAANSKGINVFVKMVEKLMTDFPSYTRDEITGFLQEFRAKKQGLTGLTTDHIIHSVSEIMVADQEAKAKAKANAERRAAAAAAPIGSQRGLTSSPASMGHSPAVTAAQQRRGSPHMMHQYQAAPPSEGAAGLPLPNMAVPPPNMAVPPPTVAVPPPSMAVPPPNMAVPPPNRAPSQSNMAPAQSNMAVPPPVGSGSVTASVPPPAPPAGAANVGTAVQDEAELRAAQQKECLICYDTLTGRQATRLECCSRYYHRECITEWFKVNRTCPTCRSHTLLQNDFPRLGS